MREAAAPPRASPNRRPAPARRRGRRARPRPSGPRRIEDRAGQRRQRGARRLEPGGHSSVAVGAQQGLAGEIRGLAQPRGGRGVAQDGQRRLEQQHRLGAVPGAVAEADREIEPLLGDVDAVVVGAEPEVDLRMRRREAPAGAAAASRPRSCRPRRRSAARGRGRRRSRRARPPSGRTPRSAPAAAPAPRRSAPGRAAGGGTAACRASPRAP